MITPEAQKFIATLAKRQDPAWFSTRKDDLQALLHGPVEAVLRETGARLMDVFPAVEDAEPRVFRIYRDVRVSKDKSPFKDHVGGHPMRGRRRFRVRERLHEPWKCSESAPPTTPK